MMKSFKQFLNEETMPYATNARGIIDIADSSVRDGLNSQLAGVTAGKFVTPYIALERVTKALANYHIFIPRHSFLEGDSGMFAWPINQFGIKIGQRDDGSFVRDGEVLKDTSKGPHKEGEDNKIVSEPPVGPEKLYSVFFEYRQTDCGMFTVYSEVVDQGELDEILADVEAELNDEGEEEDEEELNEEAVDEACWKGYRKEGMKTMFGKKYPNCVKVDEDAAKKAFQTFVRRKKTDAIIANKDATKVRTMWKKSPIKTALLGNSGDIDKVTKSVKADSEYETAKNKYNRTFRRKVDEQKHTNRATDSKPSEPTSKNDTPMKDRATIPGASTPVPSGSFSPRVPTRNTKDLDHMNRDEKGDTVVEGNKENKEKKNKVLSDGKKNLRDIRAKMKDKVNRKFDPRALKVAEETND